MTKKKPLSTEDLAAFTEAMHGVKRITYTKVTPEPPSPKTLAKRKHPIQTEPAPILAFSDTEKLEPVGSDDYLSFARPGVQHKILRNLRRGQYNVQATLDLHGMTVEETRNALSQFLQACSAQGVRFALIIHGKGRGTHKPILKNKLNLWLRQTEQVLAFYTATGQDGRGGAMYLLLRR